MFAAIVAALVLSSGQAPPSGQDPVAPSGPVELEDVVVTGRPLEALIKNFVDEVAEPNKGRGLARWHGELCVGVANLRGEAARHLIDRVSQVAEDLGVRAGRPGCAANLLIIGAADGEAFANALVRDHPGSFRFGGAGMDRGLSALRDFVAADRPVRWWQVSMPTDSQSGRRAVRLPGDCDPPILCNAAEGSVLGAAPQIGVFAASRVTTQIVDNIFRTVVVVDVDEVANLSATQLADYIAMVSLAQINPDADTTAYVSILNVFDEPSASTGLTDWDQAYLKGLYDAERNRVNHRSNHAEIVHQIRQEHAELRRTSDSPD